MNAQQLLDYIIKPTHQYMGGNYESKAANFLSLCTAAIESNCGDKIVQDNGPALGPWQMEPDTHSDTWDNCDALQSGAMLNKVASLCISGIPDNDLILSPAYACAMARLKYSMDPNPLPEYTGDSNIDSKSFYDYYKRVYNTPLGASTYDKWCTAIAANHILKVKL